MQREGTWLEFPSDSLLVYPFVAVFPNLREVRNTGSFPLTNAELRAISECDARVSVADWPNEGGTTGI